MTINRSNNFGFAWLSLCVALLANVVEDAITDFVPMYNATLLTLYGKLDWLPRLDVTFRGWLIVTILSVVILLALTPFAFRNSRWLRPIAYLFGLFAAAVAIGYLLFTLHGGTTPSVRFQGVAPGFRTAALLFAAAVYLVLSLRGSAAQ